MKELFEIYKSDILYAVIVIMVFSSLYILTKVLYKWLHKLLSEKLPGTPLNGLFLIKRILRFLWLVLGIIALSFIFITADKQILLRGYFKTSWYLAIVSVFTILAIIINNLWFRYKIKEKFKQNDDPTNFKFIRYFVAIIIGFLGAMIASLAFPSLKGITQTALGGAGIIALIAGFAAQEALANVIGGLFIIAFKPFKTGDRVKLTDTMVGTITDITLRHTVIRNFENKMIVIPNAVINKEKLINYDLGGHKLCELIEIGISYDSDIDLAKKIMQEECENHPLIFDNRLTIEEEKGDPIVTTALVELNEYSIKLRAWAWVRNFTDSFILRCDVLESIKKRFDKEGVEIPYPSRTVLIKHKPSKEDKICNSTLENTNTLNI